jgi:hypothetical protein
MDYKKYILLVIFAIVVSLWLSGCGANYHVKRAEKHMQKARIKDPEVSFVDTVYKTVVDTIESVSVDTSFFYDVDTVLIEKDRLKLRYVKVDSLVYLDAECDTLIREIEIPVTVQETLIKEVTPKWVRTLKWVLIIGGVLGIVLLVVRLVK